MFSLGIDDRDFSTESAGLDPALVHRLGEDWRNDKFAAVRRFDLVSQFMHLRGNGGKEDDAVLAHLNVVAARRADARLEGTRGSSSSTGLVV